VYDNVPGIVGVKHKGIYLMSFFNDCSDYPLAAASFYGGGPSIISSENTAGVLSSWRHLNSISGKVSSVNDIISTCIYKLDGTFISGKEDYQLEWLEEGKKFKVFAPSSTIGKSITWTYELTDDGIIITPSVGAISSGEGLYLNLPIIDQKAGDFETAFEEGKVEMKYNGGTTTLEWDKEIEGELLESITGTLGSVRRLKIKLPNSGEVSIKIKTSGK